MEEEIWHGVQGLGRKGSAEFESLKQSHSLCSAMTGETHHSKPAPSKAWALVISRMFRFSKRLLEPFSESDPWK